MILKRLYHKFATNITTLGILSTLWLLFRTGTKPSRIQYPCQQAAFSTSTLFLSPILASLCSFSGLKKIRVSKISKKNFLLRTFVFLLVISLTSFGYDSYAQSSKMNEFNSIRESWAQPPIQSDPTGFYTQAFPFPARVVSVSDGDVTTWPGSNSTWQESWGYYGDYVDQEVLDQMVEKGLKRLTGTTSLLDAWQVLIPNFQPGQKIAIKVNQNNVSRTGINIDALIHPVNSLVKGLKQLGFQETDVWVYDVTRTHPSQFTSGLRYPGVKFFDRNASFSSSDPSLQIEFDNPYYTNMPEHKLPDLLLEADYLINIPILKGHGGSAGVTFGFKNHFGSINRGPSDLHDFTYITQGTYYHPQYSPMVDIWKNPNIRDKTILILGDAIFAQWPSNAGPPRRWNSFNNDSPNMIFLSVDPVAIDSVMYDYFEREGSPMRGSDDYLRFAAQEGLGVFEHWNNSQDKDYSLIDYIHLDLDQPSFEKEDLNQDGSVNIVDLQMCMNVYLGVELDPTVGEKADVNEDGVVDISDVEQVIGRFLGW